MAKLGEQEEGPKAETGDEDEAEEEIRKLVSSFLGVSFSVFLAFLPQHSLSLVPKLQYQLREVSSRLFTAEEQLRQMKSRRKEDSKANARVVEIFASHRNAWQAEERRLMQQIDAASDEIAGLRAKVEELERERDESKRRMQELEREVGEREEMIGFMSRRDEFEDEELSGGCVSKEYYGGDENASVGEFNDGGFLQQGKLGFRSDFLASASKFWNEQPVWQDGQCEPLESIYHMKHFAARRESPWKVDGELSGVSSKLKLLEQELLNLEKFGKSDISKVPALMRKQAKRYQALAAKIDDLCRRMQGSDPCETTLSSEFQTPRQMEYLLEAFRLQQRASETGQKLLTLQTEIGRSYGREELRDEAKMTMRRSLNSIRNYLRDIQRNLEIWLARITGDLEGILSRDGASRVRESYMSRYPFVQ